MEYVWSDYCNRAVATLYNLNLGYQQGEYQSVLNACANAEEKAKYRELIDEINGIIDGYRRVHYDEHYDVFVSVKQRIGDKLTEDSKKAYEISRMLERDYNLKVFNSELTPPSAGVNYEPYILSALKSAKMLIVVAGSEEHVESPWVKNEWNRYLHFMRSEMYERNQTDRHLLPYLFGDMRTNLLPVEIQNERIQIITERFDAGKQLDEVISRVFPEKYRAKQERNNKQRQEAEEAVRKRKEAEEQRKRALEEVMGKFADDSALQDARDTQKADDKSIHDNAFYDEDRARRIKIEEDQRARDRKNEDEYRRHTYIVENEDTEALPD